MPTRDQIRSAVAAYRDKYGEDNADFVVLQGFDVDTLPESKFEFAQAMMQFDPAIVRAHAKRGTDGKVIPPRNFDELAETIWAKRNSQ